MPKEAMKPVEDSLSVEASPSLDKPVDQAHSDIAEDLKRLELELESTRDRLLRTLADFENYRRRIEREFESIGRAGKRDLILGLLDVVDSFDQAYSLVMNDHIEVEGFRAIHRQLLNLLESHKVASFASLGASFDPERHEAIGAVSLEHVEAEPGTVVQEYQRGYLWENNLLRPARVLVAQPETPSDEQA